nr:DNA polymerase [Ferrimicrobium acidiphilum]
MNRSTTPAQPWPAALFFDSESKLLPPITRADGSVWMPHEPRLVCATMCAWNPLTKHLEEYAESTWHAEGLGENWLQEFWRYVDSMGLQNPGLRVLAHNIGYDVQATGGIPALCALGWEVDSFYEKGFTYIMRLKKGRTKMTLLSSSNYYQSSLKEIGKSFDLPKLETDHQVEDMGELITYCKRDVAILSKAVRWLHDELVTNDLGNLKDTLPSTSFGVYTHRFVPENTIRIHNYEPALTIERQAYHGGRTEAFYLGDPHTTLFKVDKNSMYPSVMERFDYPNELRKYFPRSTAPSREELHDLAHMPGQFVIAQVRVNVTGFPSIPYIPEAKGRLLFPQGEFVTTLTKPELFMALSDPNVRVVDVGRTAVYSSSYIFADFIRWAFEQRLIAKTNGDEARSLLYKLLMNSLYGKFGQHSDHWTYVGNMPEPREHGSVSRVRIGDGPELKMRVIDGKVWLNDGSVMESFNSFTAVAAAVTSYARTDLAWLLGELNYAKHPAYYCDTDSLFVDAAGLRVMRGLSYPNDQPVLDDNLLGSYKLEGVSDNVYIHGAKDYMWDPATVKRKGISKDAVIDETQGTATQWQWPRSASWLRDGDLGSFANRQVVKNLHADYTKRKPLPKGCVEGWLAPHIVGQTLNTPEGVIDSDESL